MVGEGQRRKTEQRAGAAMGLGGEGGAAAGRALESSPACIEELMGPSVPSPAGKGQALRPGRTAAHRAVMGVGDSLALGVVCGADPPGWGLHPFLILRPHPAQAPSQPAPMP